MHRSVLILFISIICLSCSEPQTIIFKAEHDSIVSAVDTVQLEADAIAAISYEQDSTKAHADNKKIFDEDFFNPSNEVILSNLPFGCDVLIHHKFPSYWEIDAYNDLDHTLPHEKEFDAVGNCFKEINTVASTTLPSAKKVEKILYGNMTQCTCNDSLSLLHCRYQLPDFGPYKCYYVFSSGSYCNNCLEYGNLLLIDSLSQNAKMLNVYAETGGDQHISYRFFYITSDKSIRIFQGSCYDDGCTLKEKYAITIQQNGAILIKENQ